MQCPVMSTEILQNSSVNLVRLEFNLHCNYGAGVFAEAVTSGRFVRKFVEPDLGCFVGCFFSDP